MKKFLTSFILITVFFVAFGQQQKQDIAYLSFQNIRKKTLGPNKFFNDQTTSENILANNFAYTRKRNQYFTLRPSSGLGLQTGFKEVVEFGYQIGNGFWGVDRIKFDIITGYHINPHFYFGIGTGVRFYYDISSLVVPVYANFRAYPLKGKISPFFSFKGGYSFSIISFDMGGFIFEPGFGVNFMISKKSAISFGLGYEIQQIQPDTNFSRYFFTSDHSIVHSNAFSTFISYSFY